MAAAGIGFVSLDSIPRYSNGKPYGVPLTTFVGVVMRSTSIVEDLVYQSCALGDALYDIQYTTDEQGNRVFASGGMGFSKTYERSRAIDADMKGELRQVVLDAIAKQASPALAYRVYVASRRDMREWHETADTPIEERENDVYNMQLAFAFYLEMCVCAVHWLAFMDLQKQVRASAEQFVRFYKINTEYCREYTSGHLDDIDTWTGRIKEEKRDAFLRFLKDRKSVPTQPTARYFPRGRLMLDLNPPEESAIWAAVMIDTGLFIYMTTMDESTDNPTDEYQWDPEEHRLYECVAGHARATLADYETSGETGGAMLDGIPTFLYDLLEHTRTGLMINLGRGGTHALALIGFANKRITGVSKIQGSLSEFVPRLLAASAELEPSSSLIGMLRGRGVPADVGAIINGFRQSSGIHTNAGAVEVSLPSRAQKKSGWLSAMSDRGDGT